MEITIFNGKTHYKWPFSIAMLNYQRVSLRYILYSDCGCNQLCGDPWILHGDPLMQVDARKTSSTMTMLRNRTAMGSELLWYSPWICGICWYGRWDVVVTCSNVTCRNHFVMYVQMVSLRALSR